MSVETPLIRRMHRFVCACQTMAPSLPMKIRAAPRLTCAPVATILSRLRCASITCPTGVTLARAPSRAILPSENHLCAIRISLGSCNPSMCMHQIGRVRSWTRAALRITRSIRGTRATTRLSCLSLTTSTTLKCNTRPIMPASKPPPSLLKSSILVDSMACQPQTRPEEAR